MLKWIIISWFILGFFSAIKYLWDQLNLYDEILVKDAMESFWMIVLGYISFGMYVAIWLTDIYSEHKGKVIYRRD
jgi:hypothetical protein